MFYTAVTVDIDVSAGFVEGGIRGRSTYINIDKVKIDCHYHQLFDITKYSKQDIIILDGQNNMPTNTIQPR